MSGEFSKSETIAAVAILRGTRLFERLVENAKSDVTLLILKGHLAIEAMVDDVLARVLANPAPILGDEGKSVRPGAFARKIEYLECCFPAKRREDFDDTIELLKAFNATRNALVHSFDTDRMNLRVRSFVQHPIVARHRSRTVPDRTAEVASLPLLEQLHETMILLVTRLVIMQMELSGIGTGEGDRVGGEASVGNTE